jgi:hypothetical protein
MRDFLNSVPMGECLAEGCTDWRAWGLALCRRHEADIDERLEIFEPPVEVMILR